MNYEEFKTKTIYAGDAIKKAHIMDAVTSEFLKGFECAMYEAREIFMQMEDNHKNE